ncbi:MAG: hypothetical protein JJU36_03945 [Phycisphaeraceae bacterium]|nr:hypothetical protein [Phycisphaeraceae bacterium]
MKSSDSASNRTSTFLLMIFLVVSAGMATDARDERVVAEDSPGAIERTLFPDRTDLYGNLSPGPYRIDSQVGPTLKDEDRDRTIPIRITYPVEEGRYPVLIFCHGALGSKHNNRPLTDFLAGHGYIVVQPTFGDSYSLLSEEERRRFPGFGELLRHPRTLGQWHIRPLDVRFVIDQLPRLAREVESLKRAVPDMDRIAVGGHSFGAHTSMLLAGMKPRVGPRSTIDVDEFADERIKAFVAISPQGTGLMLTEASFRAMRGPMLMVTGDEDAQPFDDQRKGAWRRSAFDHAPDGHFYLLWLDDAHHGFGGISGDTRWPGAGPTRMDHVLLIQSTMLAFLDAHLRADKKALEYMAEADLDEKAAGMARIHRKPAVSAKDEGDKAEEASPES